MRQTKPIALTSGKLPPQALDLEEVILGALLIESEAIEKVEGILKPEHFYKDNHSVIYNAILEMHQQQEPIDMMTIIIHLKKTGKNIDAIGGPFYLTQLANTVASTAHIEKHAYIIFQQYLKREVIKINSQIVDKAFDDSNDIEDLLSELNVSVDKLNDMAVGNNNDKSIKSIAYKCYQSLQERYKNIINNVKNGIPTGIRYLKSWKNTDLIVIGARPSLGKTASMIHFAKVAASTGTPTVIFSLEQDEMQLTDRIIVGETDINSDLYNEGKIHDTDWVKIENSMNTIYSMPIIIDDTPNVSVQYIRSKCRKLKKKGKCGLVIIDYLGLMHGEGETEDIRLGNITRGLKTIAKELNIPIILLAQLNRGCEARADKKPQLSDLRGSGAIEQDADRVILIHRPAFYGLFGPQKESLEGQGKFLQVKYRNGKTGEVLFYHNESLTRIGDEPFEKPF